MGKTSHTAAMRGTIVEMKGTIVLAVRHTAKAMETGVTTTEGTATLVAIVSVSIVAAATTNVAIATMTGVNATTSPSIIAPIKETASCTGRANTLGKSAARTLATRAGTREPDLAVMKAIIRIMMMTAL